MENNDSGIKFLSVDISNFKNIKKKQVDIGGRSLIVLGANGKGKSSFINALLSPLNAKVRPSVPIMQGEERSEIEVVIGNDQKKYILNLYFTPGNQTGKLTLKDETGADLKPPASIVKSLIGEISFDLFKFLNESKADKIKTLKRLTGKAKELDLASIEIEKIKEEKKKLKDRIENAEASMNNHGFSPDDIEKYSTPIDLTPIQTELATISTAIDNYSKVENGVKERLLNIGKLEKSQIDRHDTIKRYNEEIAKLQNLIIKENDLIAEEAKKITEIDKDVKKGEEWMKNNVKPSAEAVSKKLTDASVHNGNCQRVEDFAKKQKELIKTKQDLIAKENQQKVAEKKRQEIISTSQLPVEGLTFDDNEILYQGLPLEIGQQNQQTLMDISSKIAVAMNPNLRTIFLHEASLYDKDHLVKIIKELEAKNFQVICEVVDQSGGDLEIKFVETEIQ